MTPFVLGVDSGGTKYLVRAAALDGTVLGEYKGQTCSHYGLNEEIVVQRINENIDKCLSAFDGERKNCVCLVCGVAGFDSPEDGKILENIYTGLNGFSCPVYCVNDVELAHYAATGGVGVLILAGTGSIAFGRNKNGKELRIGGWLRSIMGDEGSGRYIDAYALHHYSRWLDGCCDNSPLLREIAEITGAKTRKELMDYAVQIATPPWQGPNLGAVVDNAASNGDMYATDILKHAAWWNFDMANETIKQLDMGSDCNLCIGIWGSVLMNSTVQREELKRLLIAHYPKATLCIPKSDAVQSAVDVAILWHKYGGECKDVLAGNIK